MNYKDKHVEYMKLAIEKSKESLSMGNFPAGAVVVKDGVVISSEVSSPYPGLFHADSKALSSAFEKHGSLSGASLYIGLESCLMCTGVAYWSGIRNIYFAIPKLKVNSHYYEISTDVSHLCAEFHEPIILHHISELEDEAIQIVRSWEDNIQNQI